MPRFPSFVGETQTGQSLIADSQRTVNLYVERAPDGVSALYPTPGFQAWGTVAAHVTTRAAIFVEGRLFAIIGGGLYEFMSDGSWVLRGLVTPDTSLAQFIYNGRVGGQIGICSGGNFYDYELSTNVLTLILANEVTMVAYAGGYAFAFNALTGRTRLSNLNDFRTWDPGTFFQRSLFADPCQTMFADANNLIWLIGTETFEVRYNTGTGTQPWAPLTGLTGPYGIAAPLAFGRGAAGNYWLAQNGEGYGPLVLTKGASPQAVGNYVVANALAGYLRTSRIDDAEILTYQQDGHSFAIVAFPAAGATWCYDADTSSWTERGLWNAATGRYDLWAPRVHVTAWGKHLVGDRTTGTLWKMDTSVATDVNGQGIRRLRRSAHLNREHKRVPLDTFELLMDVGLGLASGQGSDPQVMLRLSIDGGRTFGNERIAGVGKLGEYRKLVKWNRLGAPADAVVEVTYSEPTPFRIVDAFINNNEAAA